MNSTGEFIDLTDETFNVVEDLTVCDGMGWMSALQLEIEDDEKPNDEPPPDIKPKFGRISVRKDTELLQVYANVSPSGRSNVATALPNTSSISFNKKNSIPVNIPSTSSSILGLPVSIDPMARHRPVWLKDSITGRRELVYVVKCLKKNVSVLRRPVPQLINENSALAANLEPIQSPSQQQIALQSVANQTQSSPQTPPVADGNDNRTTPKTTRVPLKPPPPPVTVLNPDHRALLSGDKTKSSNQKNARPDFANYLASIGQSDNEKTCSPMDRIRNVIVSVKRMTPVELRRYNVKGKLISK